MSSSETSGRKRLRLIWPCSWIASCGKKPLTPWWCTPDAAACWPIRSSVSSLPFRSYRCYWSRTKKTCYYRQGCGLGLDVSVSRRSWYTPTSCLGLVTVSAICVSCSRRYFAEILQATSIKWAKSAVTVMPLAVLTRIGNRSMYLLLTDGSFRLMKWRHGSDVLICDCE